MQTGAGKSSKEEVLTISLKEPKADTEKNQEEKKETKPYHQDEENVNNHKMKREDTVDLGSADVKYMPYLKKIKRKIDVIWIYPQAALEQRRRRNRHS